MQADSTNKKKIVMMLAAFIFFMSGAADAETVGVEGLNEKLSADSPDKKEGIMIISGHPGYPPIMWQTGTTITGVGAELAETVCRELKIQYEIKYSGPWKRVQENARNGSIDLIIGIYANDARKKYLDYTVHYMSEPTYIVSLKGRPFFYEKKEDLVGKTGVTIHGESFGQDLDDFIQSSLNIKRVYTGDALFKNLMTGRADYILWGYYPILTSAAKMGCSDKIIAYDKAPVAVENLYMAFSKKSVFSGRLKQVDAIIHRLRKNGTLEKWSKKYIRAFRQEHEASGPVKAGN